jgi:hypothetical protein
VSALTGKVEGGRCSQLEDLCLCMATRDGTDLSAQYERN